MRIAEVAERSGLTVSAIRYYEKSGLCPPISRGPDGKRQFNATDLDWLTLLSSLRETGMTLSDMRAFAALYRGGDETIPERKSALLKHRDSLAIRQVQLDRCHDILNRKLKKYQEIIGESP